MATSTAYPDAVATVKTRHKGLKAPAGNPDPRTFLQGQQILDWQKANQRSVDGRYAMMTPDIASKLIATNTKNRRVMKSKVSAYAYDMEIGKFPATSSALSWDWDGALQNGQHRLLACIASQATFYTMLVKGLSPASFMMEDTQIKRTLADLLCIEGEKHYQLLAGTLVHIAQYVATVRSLAGQSHRPRLPGLSKDDTKIDTLRIHATRAANWERWEILQEHPGLRHSVELYMSSRTSFFVNKSILAALHYLGSRAKEDVTKEFLQKLTTNVGIKNGEPVGHLLKVLQVDSARPRGHGMRGSDKLLYAIKALRFTLEGKLIKALDVRLRERKAGKTIPADPIVLLEDLVPESKRIK